MWDFFGMLGSARRLIGIGTGVLALALFANGARADAIYTMDLLNFSGFNGPYATVDVKLTSSTAATITFTALTNGSDTYLMGGQGAAGLNVNATTFTITGITSTTYAGFTAGPVTQASAGNEDGFGSFNATLDSSGGYTTSNKTITFTLTNTSGTWTSDSNVLTGNNKGNFVAAHIFAAGTNPPTTSGGALNTGYASDSDSPNLVTAPLPAPAYAGLALMGMMGLMLKLGRRRLA